MKMHLIFYWITGIFCLNSPGLAQESSKGFPAHPTSGVKISELLERLDRENKLDPVFAVAKEQILKTFPSSEAQKALIGVLKTAQKNKNWKALDRFPKIALSRIEDLRPLINTGGASSQTTKPQPLTGNIKELLTSPCSEKPKPPKIIHPKVPHITDGHFLDADLSDCFVHQSLTLAKILNALLSSEESNLYYDKTKILSPKDLLESLVDDEHKVVMQNEKMYANFISLNTGHTPVIWPVWLDTGLVTPSGSPVEIPVGHSHHSWIITGPMTNTKVAFYLGIGGVGFYSQVDQRPAWTGLKIVQSFDSNNTSQYKNILNALEATKTYTLRIKKEAELYAKNLPLNGYGFLGVCNDSNAILEAITHQLNFSFPLLRAQKLKEAPMIDDGLQGIIDSLPSDATESGKNRNASLKRIITMYPFEKNEQKSHDPLLNQVMEEISLEVFESN